MVVGEEWSSPVRQYTASSSDMPRMMLLCTSASSMDIYTAGFRAHFDDSAE